MKAELLGGGCAGGEGSIPGWGGPPNLLLHGAVCPPSLGLPEIFLTFVEKSLQKASEHQRGFQSGSAHCICPSDLL